MPITRPALRRREGSCICNVFVCVIITLLLHVVPGQPILTVDDTSATFISLSWSVPGDSVVDSYEVMWTSDECPDNIHNDSTTITDTSYTIHSLRGGTSYSITVSATNSGGTANSDSVVVETWEKGEYIAIVNTRK